MTRCPVLMIAAALLICATGQSQSTGEQRVNALVNQAKQRLQRNDHAGWAKLMMQADSEAMKLERRTHEPNKTGRYAQISPDTRLTYLWNGIAQVECYQHDLLSTVVKAEPGTRWGADALVELLRSGCYLYEDQRVPLFKTVIEMLSASGWPALQDPRLDRIEGEAYETWWSLSKASPDEPMLVDNDVSPSSFTSGAEDARLKAIAAYERVLRREKDLTLRHRVEELKSRHGTDQRTWFRWGD